MISACSPRDLGPTLSPYPGSNPNQARLAQPAKLRVAELKAALQREGLSQHGKKDVLVARWSEHLRSSDAHNGPEAAAEEAGGAAKAALPLPRTPATPRAMRSARGAAADKRAAGESGALEQPPLGPRPHPPLTRTLTLSLILFNLSRCGGACGG